MVRTKVLTFKHWLKSIASFIRHLRLGLRWLLAGSMWFLNGSNPPLMRLCAAGTNWFVQPFCKTISWKSLIMICKMLCDSCCSFLTKLCCYPCFANTTALFASDTTNIRYVSLKSQLTLALWCHMISLFKYKERKVWKHCVLSNGGPESGTDTHTGKPETATMTTRQPLSDQASSGKLLGEKGPLKYKRKEGEKEGLEL